MHLVSEILNNLLVLAVNLSDFRGSVLDWIFQPYTKFIGNLLYPILGCVVVGLVFGLSKKYIGALAGIFIVWATFGLSDPFVNNPIISMFISILASLLVVGLVMLLFMRPEKDYGGG